MNIHEDQHLWSSSLLVTVLCASILLCRFCHVQINVHGHKYIYAIQLILQLNIVLLLESSYCCGDFG